MRKSLLIVFAAIIAAGVFLQIARNLILAGYLEPNFSANSLSGVVSKSLDNSNVYPVVGKDYNIKSVEYFDKGEWVVINIASINQSRDNSIMVAKRQNGQYVAVVSPGSSISYLSVSGLPTDVLYYLNSLGVVDYRP